MPTNCVYSSICLRVISLPFGTRMTVTRPFESLAGPWNTLKSTSFTISATSTISNGLRKSGLSEPKRRIASCQVITGNLPKSTPIISCHKPCTIRSIISRTSGAVKKEVSTSIWVNSGWRSARKSSSRKHFTI